MGMGDLEHPSLILVKIYEHLHLWTAYAYTNMSDNIWTAYTSMSDYLWTAYPDMNNSSWTRTPYTNMSENLWTAYINMSDKFQLCQNPLILFFVTFISELSPSAL